MENVVSSCALCRRREAVTAVRWESGHISRDFCAQCLRALGRFAGTAGTRWQQVWSVPPSPESADAFAAAVESVLPPEDAELHFDLGIMNRELHMPHAAIREMGLVLQHAPEGPNAERALSVVLEPKFLKGSIDDALGTLRELLFAN